MADPKHVAILRQGVEVWNHWRQEHPFVKPDLSGAILNKVDLSKIKLNGANLIKTSFYGTNLSESNLASAKLLMAYFDEVNLHGADIRRADLTLSTIKKTLFGEANLKRADLRQTILLSCDFKRANFSQSIMMSNIFGRVDLRMVKGLETIYHMGPSTIGIDTIILSYGHIPEIFLRGAGVPPSIIEQIPALVGSLSPIDYYTCFISYSGADESFAEHLHADLLAAGVRCWFAPHDLRTGQRIRYGINEAIRQYDKLVLILSKDSIASTWVEFEVEAALDKEKNGSEVLFPIRLDSTVLESSIPWARYLKQTRHICDFTYWKNYEDYKKAFNRLLRDLKANT